MGAFFDVCSASGLTGDEGVLIPAGNRDALMLRDAISTVEEGVASLTGVPVGAHKHGAEA